MMDVRAFTDELLDAWAGVAEVERVALQAEGPVVGPICVVGCFCLSTTTRRLAR